MGSDLFLRFIGLDLVSRVAERAGNSVDRLSNRTRAASASSIAGMERQAATQARLDELTRASTDSRLAGYARQSQFANNYASASSGAARKVLADEERVAAAEQRLSLGKNAAQMQAIRMEERVAAQTAASEEIIRREHAMTAQSFIAGGIAAVTFGIGILAGVAGLVALSGASIHASNQFRSDMVMVVTHAGLASRSIDQVSNDLIQMGPAVGFGPDELAKAFFHVQSAATSLGPTFQSLAAKEDILRESAKLAAVGHSDLVGTTNSVVSVLGAYHKTITSASEAASQLNAIVGNGNVTMQQFDSAMRGGLLPISAQAGVSLASLGAAFGTLTDMGYGASQAATYLRSAIIQMSMPSGPAAKALAAIGVAGDDVAKQMGFFNEVLSKAGINQSELANDLQKSGSLSHTLNTILMPALQKSGLSGHDAAALIEKSFGGIRSGAGIVGLTNNLGSLESKEKLITKSTKDWADTWAFFNAQDPDFAVKQVKSGLEALAIIMGRALMPAFLQFMNFLGPLIQKLIEFVNTHADLISKITVAAIVIGAMLGLLLTMGGTIAIVGGALGALGPVLEGVGGAIIGIELGPFLIVLAAVGVALLLVHGYWTEISQVAKIFSDELKRSHNATSALYLALMSMGAPMDTAKRIAFDLQGALQKMSAIFKIAKDAIVQAFNQIKDSIPQSTLNQLSLSVMKFAEALQRYVLPVLGIVVLVIGSLLGGVFKALISALTVLIPGALQVLSHAFDLISAVLRLFGDFLGGMIKIVVDLIHGDWQGAWNDAKDMVTHLMQDVEDIFTAGFNLVVSVIGTVLGTIKALVTGLVTGVIGAFQHLWSVLVGHSIIPDMARDILNVFLNLGPNVLSTIGGWIEGVISKFSGLASQAFSIMSSVGKNIVDGITSGLRNAWSGLTGALSSLASSLPEPIRHALGITSPSRVFAAQVGLPISQGIAAGIMQGAGHVNASLGRIVGGQTNLPVFGSTSSPVSVGAQIGAGAASGAQGSNATDGLLVAIHEVLTDIKEQGDRDAKSGSVVNQPRRESQPALSVNELSSLLYALVNKGAARRNGSGLRSEFNF